MSQPKTMQQCIYKKSLKNQYGYSLNDRKKTEMKCVRSCLDKKNARIASKSNNDPMD